MLFIVFILTSCSNVEEKTKNVGLLIEGSIEDQTWGEKGHNGLMLIKEELGANVYYQEGVKSQIEVNRAVAEFADNDVKLIFGHSSNFGRFFQEISDDYPDIQFVYFNGNTFSSNVMSINFNAHAMGFFAGMVAASMTNTNHVGVIAAYEWQPEVEGFYEGAKYVNPDIKVDIEYVNSWDDRETALDIFHEMEEEHVDVFYPAGDGYNVPVINEIKKNGLYAIGFISDQIHLGESTILTSTVQHVDRLYVVVAERFFNDQLTSGILFFDFADGVITMGEFSEEVPWKIENKIKKVVQRYIDTGNLPNE
nr:BMP family ABC transporter substrate-binding protein [Salirhabdus salicampi]